jgi:hypothetical protein
MRISAVRAVAVDENEDISGTAKRLFEFPVELFEDVRLVGPQLTTRNENSVACYDFSSYDFRIASQASVKALPATSLNAMDGEKNIDPGLGRKPTR